MFIITSPKCRIDQEVSENISATILRFQLRSYAEFKIMHVARRTWILIADCDGLGETSDFHSDGDVYSS